MTSAKGYFFASNMPTTEIHRTALLFDPELHASPAVQVCRVRAPYLEKLTSVPHSPNDSAAWRKSIINPGTVPNLTHTGSTHTQPNLLRPDGTVSTALREAIISHLQRMPAAHQRDIAHRDYERLSRNRASTPMRTSASGDASLSETSCCSDGISASTYVDSIFAGIQEGRHCKRPYSSASLARMMLHSQYDQL